MALRRTLTFVVVPIALLAAALGASGGCSATEGAIADASDGATKDTTPEDTLCTRPNPSSGAKCSPTLPCPAPFSCFYAEGCDSPQGQCQLWEVCMWGDTAMEVSYCGCDGAIVDDKTPHGDGALCTNDAGKD